VKTKKKGNTVKRELRNYFSYLLPTSLKISENYANKLILKGNEEIFGTVLQINYEFVLSYSMITLGKQEIQESLREEHQLEVCEKKVLRKVFGPERQRGRESTILHKEEIYDACRSFSIVRLVRSRTFRWAARIARTVAIILGQKPSGRPKRRLEESVKVDFRKILHGSMN
jgi:hypothetical protein